MNVAQSLIPVMEHFYTVQGEGFNSGLAAYFIRTGGCDVGCTWCDVKESWPMEAHPKYSVEQLIQWVNEAAAKNVVITGGEPCMHDLSTLTMSLKKAGLQLWLETSGAYPISGNWDWIVISPKKFKKPLVENLKLAHELKVVVCTAHDLKWAQQHAELVNSNCKLYLQPEWDRKNKVQDLIVDFVKQNPLWRVSLQTHKYLEIP